MPQRMATKSKFCGHNFVATKDGYKIQINPNWIFVATKDGYKIQINPNFVATILLPQGMDTKSKLIDIKIVMIFIW